MSYKDIALREEMIKSKLEEFADGPVEITPKGSSQHYSFEKDGNPILLQIYPKAKGLFTLMEAGKNKDIAKQAAEYLIKHAEIIQPKNFSLSLPGYNEERFELLKGYLVESCDASQEGDPEEKPHGVATKIRGVQGDVLTFTLYKTGTLLVQGHPVVLAIDLIEFLADDNDVSQEDLFSHIGTIFKTPTTAEEATAQLAEEYSFAYKFAGDNLTKILSTAISMQGLPILVADYSVISNPALRALEAFMRKAMVNACDLDRRGFNGVFENNRRRYRVAVEMKKTINCGQTCTLLEECYPVYRSHRHGTFHAGGVDGDIRVIEDRAEALSLSAKCLGLINKHSAVLLGKK